jgi:hypothetical protein
VVFLLGVKPFAFSQPRRGVHTPNGMLDDVLSWKMPTYRLQNALLTGMHKSLAFSAFWLLRGFSRQILQLGNCSNVSTSCGEHYNKEFKAHVAYSNGHPEIRTQQVRISESCCFSSIEIYEFS